MVKIMIVDDHLLMRRVVREVIEQESDLEVVAEAHNGFEAVEQAAQTQPDVILMDLDMPGCDGFEATERVLACSPNSHVVIFTASQQEQHVFQAIQRGAIGYVTKDVEPDALVFAIRSAARNDLCIPGQLAAQVVAHLRTNGRVQHASIWSTPMPEGNAGSAEPFFAGDTHRFISPVSSATISYRTPRRSITRQTSTAPLPEQSSPSQAGTTRPLTERECEILDLIRRGRKNREIAGELSIAESTVHKHIQNIFEKLHARNRTEAIYLTGPR